MKIQYENKEFKNADIGTPNKNKVTDNDMNEIKAVVNTNADTLQTAQETLTTYVSETDTRLGDMQDDFDDINASISNIEDDISDIEGDISNIEDNTYTKTEVNTLLDEKASNTALGNEATVRENADTSLQRQIDSIVASSDVVDIVGTYQDLQNYDTSKLGDNDIVKVLDDNTHNNATSYYRWKKSQSQWQYVGSEGPYYTKSETDTLLNGKVDKVAGKGLSTNDFTDADKTKLNGIESGAEVNKIETIKVNGSSQTITEKSVNISVPTKTSDLNNDSGFITKDVNNLTNYYKKTEVDTTLGNYYTKSQVYNKTEIDSLIGDINSALDTINGEVI